MKTRFHIYQLGLAAELDVAHGRPQTGLGVYHREMVSLSSLTCLTRVSVGSTWSRMYDSKEGGLSYRIYYIYRPIVCTIHISHRSR